MVSDIWNVAECNEPRRGRGNDLDVANKERTAGSIALVVDATFEV